MSTLVEAKLEKSFLTYRVGLIEWNEAIGNLHTAQRRSDTPQNRIKTQVAHDELRVAYDRYKKCQKNLQLSILEDQHIKPHWTQTSPKEDDN